MKFFEHGFEIIDNFISEDWLKAIEEEIDRSDISTGSGGVRHINKKLNSVAQYLNSNEFNEKLKPFIPYDAELVRAILFNKTEELNWYVTWHQDKTVSVSAEFDEEGWRAWSVKEDILHVQPPLAVLETMVTIRIHMDPTPKENGCLKVIPNSHKLGILTPEEISQLVATEEAYFCEAEKCAALIMRPHLLHASSKSVNPNNRRVLHFEFSSWQLPRAVCWG